MFAKMMALVVVAGVLAACTVRISAIDEKTHEGKVVAVAEGKLMMTDKDGTNEHTHAIPDTAKITLDGKTAKLFDLKKNDVVRVTVDGGGKVSTVAATHAM